MLCLILLVSFLDFSLDEKRRGWQRQGRSRRRQLGSDKKIKIRKIAAADPSEELLGGHAVMAVGYEESSRRFLVRNSWGADWGLGGYFTMPYAYLTDPALSSDIWTVRLIET